MENLLFLGVPILKHIRVFILLMKKESPLSYEATLMCLNAVTSKTINFPVETNGTIKGLSFSNT